MDEERPVEKALDTVGDEETRDVLAAVSEGPRSARKLGESLSMSLPTVYRRIETLEENDLVRSETYVAEGGNHYDVHESNFDSTVIRLEDEQNDVRIHRKENVPDRFASLWNDLGR
ncbi:transcriptional regulator [Halobacteriales archaeon SW_5_70_135]|nr:MAG: transcriptional regulator [Halobacteriales archaeon SW_5_70_135]